MANTDLQNLSAAEFKRLCGVSRNTFSEMVAVLRPNLGRLGRSRGREQTEHRRPTTCDVGVLT